jgi:hypothetical protein
LKPVWAKSWKDRISKNKPGMVVHTVIPAMQEAEVGGSWPKAQEKNLKPYVKK